MPFRTNELQVFESSTCRSGAAQLGVEGFSQEEVVSVEGGRFSWRTAVLPQVVFSDVGWVSVRGAPQLGVDDGLRVKLSRG